MIKNKFQNCLILLLLLSLISVAFSQDSTPVGPGVIHHHEFIATGPWHIHILEVDLTNKWLQLETVKANDLLAGYERTSSMAARNDREGHRIIGAINGDFYGTGGVPVGAQVSSGVLLKTPANRSIFAITDLKQPLIDIVAFRGTIISTNHTMLPIDGVNEVRENNELIIYNKFFGSRTGTNYWGTEITALYLPPAPLVNDTILVVAVAKDSILGITGHGNNVIPANGIVISGHGTAGTFLNDIIFVGDTLKLVLELPPLKKSITQLIGGTPRLIRNGVASVEWQREGCGESFTYDRHPRTAIGFSQDSTRLYLFTVDGRQPGYSAGMSLFELADYMLKWQVYQGVNLDGGGSTTMVVRGKVANSPSDAGGERSVANALMVVSTAATGSVAILRISPQKAFVLTENQLQLSVAGFDEFYNPVKLATDSIVWSCDQRIGTITANGLFISGGQQDSGYVYAAYGSARDSAKIYITSIASIQLLPNPIVLKIGTSQSIEPETKDSYGNIIALPRTAYQWAVTGDIGTVSNDGIFTATKQGQGQVQASYRSVTGATTVYVGISSTIIIDDFQSPANWTISGTRVNLANCAFTSDNSAFVSPPRSGKLDYSLTTGGTSALYLNCSIPISGAPEAVGIHVYGDGQQHWLRGEFEDADKEKFLVNFTEAAPGIDWTNTWRYLLVPFKNAIVHWGNPAATLTFPITWTKIYLAETSDQKKNAGTIYLDDFTVHFIETDVEQRGDIVLPENYYLGQNYPNPFNPITQITFGLPQRSHVTLDIFNLRGELISQLLNSQLDPGEHRIDFNAAELTSGVYLYRLDVGSFQSTRKMVLIR
ncbi:MAG: phosphodiester glycosidase family protein [candidate division KSB1 bacterium]|nr:phosphodiester glycosidase family protein [candidate division KSB1 bacterium]